MQYRGLSVPGHSSAEANLDQRNRNPKPFVWTADADLILGKVERLCKRISRSGH